MTWFLLALQAIHVAVIVWLARRVDSLHDQNAALDQEARILRFVCANRGLDVPPRNR